MAVGLPYIATTYELYHDVYGSKGAVAPLLTITRDSPVDSAMPDDFVDSVLQILTDPRQRELVVARNRMICERFFSLKSLEDQLQELFPDVDA